MTKKTFFQELKTLFDGIDVRKAHPNYVFKKWLFYAYLGFLLLLILHLGSVYGYERTTYFRCEMGTCIHPDGYLVIAPYEEGTPAPKIVKYFFLYALTGLALMFLVNHLLFNTWRTKTK